SNKLDQVPRYPERAEKPVIVSAGEQRQAIAYVVLGRMKSDPLPIDREKSYAENFIKPRLERVPGVGLVEVYGGRERELQVILKPGALAMYRLSVQDVISALRRENRDTSAGYFDEGKRRYILRVLGEYRRPGDVEAVVIKRVGQTPVRIRDVARVVLGFGDENTIVRQHDEKTLVFKVVQTAGTNVLTVMDHLKKTIKDLNREYLVHRNLELRQVYDSRRGAGGPGPAGFPQERFEYPGGDYGHSHKHHRHIPDDYPVRPQHQRDLPGGHEFRHRHGGGQLHRGDGKYLQAQADGRVRAPGRPPGHAGGHGCRGCFHPDHHRCLRPGGVRGRGGGTALPGHRHCHRQRRVPEPVGLGERYPLHGGPDAQGQETRRTLAGNPGETGDGHIGPHHGHGVLGGGPHVAQAGDRGVSHGIGRVAHRGPGAGRRVSARGQPQLRLCHVVSAPGVQQ
ncbi:MAG: efflux RND transporter permease subunit, partial [Deltaproteobacteria bacterium]|nr:efflux RND transporter permease subunit [Deltaproteobacteria bacterium]